MRLRKGMNMKFSAKEFMTTAAIIGISLTYSVFAALKPTPFPGTVNDVPFAKRVENKKEGYEPYKNKKAYDVPAFKQNDSGFYDEVFEREGKEALCRIKPDHDKCMPSIKYNTMGGTKPKDCPTKYRRTEGTIVDCITTRNASEFLGWSRTIDCTKPEIAPVIGANESADILFYACWKCISTATPRGNECICNDQAMDDKCLCTGAYLELDTNTNMCKCFDGIENARVNTPTKQCVCNDSKMDIAKQCLVELQCPDPTYMDSDCNCLQGMGRFGDSCQCVDSEGNPNPREDKENSCACFDSKLMDAANDCKCKGQLEWNDASGKCECPFENTEYNDGSKKCECSDPRNMVQNDDGNCECTNPDHVVIDGKCLSKEDLNIQENNAYVIMQCRSYRTVSSSLSNQTMGQVENALRCQKRNHKKISKCFHQCKSDGNDNPDYVQYLNKQVANVSEPLSKFCAGDTGTGHTNWFSHDTANNGTYRTIFYTYDDAIKIFNTIQSGGKTDNCITYDTWFSYDTNGPLSWLWDGSWEKGTIWYIILFKFNTDTNKLEYVAHTPLDNY